MNSSGKLRVGEAIIDLLVREYELDTVFGIPGVHNIELFRGLHRSASSAGQHTSLRFVQLVLRPSKLITSSAQMM